MPGDFYYESESGVFVTSYWGAVSILDILETILRRSHDPRIQSAKANVVDLSHATWTETQSKLVRAELERLRPALGPPKAHNTVFVAPGEFFYGFARMYAIVQITYSGSVVQVTRSWTEAAKLLGLDLSKAEAGSREIAAEGSQE
jgi:hypothetical protein